MYTTRPVYTPCCLLRCSAISCIYSLVSASRDTRKRKQEELPQTRRLFLSRDAGKARTHARIHTAPLSRCPHSLTLAVAPHTVCISNCRLFGPRSPIWRKLAIAGQTGHLEALASKGETLLSVTLVRLGMQVKPDREDGESRRGVDAACRERGRTRMRTRRACGNGL